MAADQYTTPNRRGFTVAKSNARRRGIPFLLTFEQWKECWDRSLKWPLRGRKRGQYQMDRIENSRGYELGNIQIVSGAVNRTKDSPHGWNPLLSQEAVHDIRTNFKKHIRGWPYFAEKYGVSIATIKAVRTRRNWRTV